MFYKRASDDKKGQPKIYQIRVEGHLGRQLADRFDELSITLEDTGSTLITGQVVDQAALYGLLRKIRDLGIVLLSVNSIGTLPDDPLKFE
jgi:hypothetical protein